MSIWWCVNSQLFWFWLSLSVWTAQHKIYSSGTDVHILKHIFTSSGPIILLTASINFFTILPLLPYSWWDITGCSPLRHLVLIYILGDLISYQCSSKDFPEHLSMQHSFENDQFWMGFENISISFSTVPTIKFTCLGLVTIRFDQPYMQS